MELGAKSTLRIFLQAYKTKIILYYIRGSSSYLIDIIVLKEKDLLGGIKNNVSIEPKT
jgi:hypothetical protein